jgi:DnaA family protein
MKQIPLAIGPAPLPTFESYLTGANEAAVAHLHALHGAGAPVYLWGPPGSGKTHLLHALARERQARGERVACLGADVPLPWRFDERWALVVVDDCHRLDAEQQQAAFSLFVQATAAGADWLAAGRLPPVDLPLRDDLRTRLGWGHVFALQPPTEPETRAVLRREADRRGIRLSDEVLDHLMRRLRRDLGSLMRVLDRLDAFALTEKRAVTLPLLRQMFDEQPADAGVAP